MAILLLIEIAILLFLRKIIAHNFVQIIQRLGGSRTVAIWLYAVISLPGVLSHEISHFLYASLLGLRTGSIELLPQMDSQGGVDLGSVQVEQKDPFRMSLVGLAPLITGILLLPWISSYIPFALPIHITWQNSVALYMLMTISLNMTPSKRDMASWPVVAVLFTLFLGGFLFLGFRIPFTQTVTTNLDHLLNQTIQGLAVALLFALIFSLLGSICLWSIVQLGKRTYAN